MIRLNAIIMSNKLLTSSSYSLLRLINSSIYQRRLLSNTLSVCTFNVLAPCYKRLKSEYDRESSYESLWKERHLSIINLFQTMDINLICFQEFWLKNRSFTELYQTNLSKKYSFFTLRRTGLLDDGLAILVDSKSVKINDKCEFRLNDIGHRVALLLNIEFNGHIILLINLHLTFPHYRFERHVRLKQIRKFLKSIKEYQISKNLLNQCSIFLCGDFNASYNNDPVYQFIERKQYISSFKSIHGYEPYVTHLTHRNEQLGVDYIFYKSNILEPISSELLPKGANHFLWNDHTNWNLSDHRALLTTFQQKE